MKMKMEKKTDDMSAAAYRTMMMFWRWPGQVGPIALCPLAGAGRVDSCGDESEPWLAQRTLTHPAAQGICLMQATAAQSTSAHGFGRIPF